MNSKPMTTGNFIKPAFVVKEWNKMEEKKIFRFVLVLSESEYQVAKSYAKNLVRELFRGLNEIWIDGYTYPKIVKG